MNKKILLGAVVVVLVVVGIVALKKRAPEPVDTTTPATTTVKASMVPYESDVYGIRFEYPSNLYLKESKPERAKPPKPPLLSILLVEDTEENRMVVNGSSTDAHEGPTAITIDVYENEDELSAPNWAVEDTNWEVASSVLIAHDVDDVEGVSYTWSGLYEGKNIIVTVDDRAYVFSVTWMTPDDQLLRDFNMVLDSTTLQE